ncbi:MAG: dephospho-CoA kinase [Planctomycetes bacterium RBG_16_59_8]|nr:MAG: dephospho-CoA kinase [Planctomycetes bacterium RBG_16_59_8]
MPKIVAIVGMTGSGKSELTAFLVNRGWHKVRFGDLTEEELRRRRLAQTSETERIVREDLRQKHGMAVFATLNLGRVEEALQKGNVVIDGLYSWAEYMAMKKKYADNLVIIAVSAAPKTRYTRLASRAVRPLRTDEAQTRDHAEIEHIQKAGPIAMADYTIVNEGSMEELNRQCEEILSKIG